MAFEAYKTVWQLRPGVKVPFAAQETALQQAELPQEIDQGVQEHPLSELEQGAPVKSAQQAQSASKPRPLSLDELAQAGEQIVQGALQAEKLQQAAAHPTQAAPAAATASQSQALEPQHAAAKMAASANSKSQAALQEVGVSPRPVLYVSAQLSLSYLSSLLGFVQKKGVQPAFFVAGMVLPPKSVLLLSPGESGPADALSFSPDENKAALWSFLKQALPQLS